MTESTAIEVTTPSLSVAETAALTGVPCCVVWFAGHVITGDRHEWVGDALFLGVGAPPTKSVPLSFVSRCSRAS